MNNYRKDGMGHRRQTSETHADLRICCTRIAAEALYRGVNVSPLSSSKVTASQSCQLHKCHFPKSDFLELNFVYIFCDPENNILLIRQSSVNLLTCSLIIPASYSSVSLSLSSLYKLKHLCLWLSTYGRTAAWFWHKYYAHFKWQRVSLSDYFGPFLVTKYF